MTAPEPDLHTLRNRTFDELAPGDSASIERVLGIQDIQLFALLSGDIDPAHGAALAERRTAAFTAEPRVHMRMRSALEPRVLGDQ